MKWTQEKLKASKRCQVEGIVFLTLRLCKSEHLGWSLIKLFDLNCIFQKLLDFSVLSIWRASDWKMEKIKIFDGCLNFLLKELLKVENFAYCSRQKKDISEVFHRFTYLSLAYHNSQVSFDFWHIHHDTHNTNFVWNAYYG